MAKRSTVRGDRELIANLRTLRRDMGGDVLDRASIDALQPLEEQTRVNTRAHRRPGRTPRGGHLDQGVVTRRRQIKGRFVRIYWVAFTRRARRLAHLVEFGTAPHWQPKRNRMHPGARAFRPMTRAFEAQKARVVTRWARNYDRFLQMRVKGLYRGISGRVR